MKSRPLVFLLLIIVAVQAVVLARLQGWSPWHGSEAQKPAMQAKNVPVKIERIQGTDLKRLTLTAKAASRIDIQTAPVRDQQVMRKRLVAGEISALSVEPVVKVSGPGVPTKAARFVVRVPITSDLSNVNRNQSVTVLPIGHDTGTTSAPGKLIDLPAGNDSKDAVKALHYEVEGSFQNLSAGQRVNVEYVLASANGTGSKVIPYAAVVYDAKGAGWVYTNPEPLVFVRHRISVDFIQGDQAVLLEGPPTGTQVVTVGVIQLYGSEFFVSH